MLYLASSSPRRAELLRQIGVKFEIIQASIDESAKPGESARELVNRLCREKALKGRLQLQQMQSHDLVMAADTLIHLHGQVIGKPQSKQHCCDILQQLSGQTHQVLSAVAVVDANGQLHEKCTSNEITFRPLEVDEIWRYCALDEPHDKAGAYAIQGRAAIFIEHLSGSYSSVMGLPLFETAQLLTQAGYDLTAL